MGDTIADRLIELIEEEEQEQQTGILSSYRSPEDNNLI